MAAWNIAGLVTGALLLAACTPESQDYIARESAKSVVNPILAQRFPGLPITPLSNCVIDNATAPEIVTLASSSVSRTVTPQAVQIVNEVLARPTTIECISTAGIGIFLGGRT